MRQRDQLTELGGGPADCGFYWPEFILKKLSGQPLTNFFA